MFPKRCVYLLVILLLVFVGSAAAGNPTELPASRDDTHPLPTNSPQPEMVIQASGTVNLTLFSQSFSSPDMPLSWQTMISNPARSWSIIDATLNITDYTRFVHTFPYAAFITYDLSPQDEWLYTPPITIPLSFTDTKLSFWALGDTNFLSATVIVSATSSTGITTTIWTLNDEYWPNFIYRQVQYDLTPFIGQTIRIIWRYVGYNGQSFGLDDIEVSGNAKGIWLPFVAK
ncbi:MAG: choice-of-anchor J domain-containing protein [Anaerolineae bacterium]